ncbi:MAG TPA: ABC transporter permease subunit, partial [Gaiellales bacterium]|nr:ABC transporter permease subunit [Gaiellales bacterium]
MDRPAVRGTPGWAVVLEQEMRDLWLGGRGLPLSLAFSLLLSVIAYLVATNTALNFLEERESVDLLEEVAIAVGGLLALLAAADAVSGERERATLETLLLAPVPRRQLIAGKLLAALSLWLAALAIMVPYVWFL